jgi:hypothetical protein
MPPIYRQPCIAEACTDRWWDNPAPPATLETVSEDEIARKLAEEGLVRLPQLRDKPRADFKPITVQGEPLSEMIIRERGRESD